MEDAQKPRAAAPNQNELEERPSNPGSLIELELPGFEPALVFLPKGPGPYPVLFATHGAGGRAEHHCVHWLHILEEPHVIVCPRGRRMVKSDPSGGYYYPTHTELEKEVLATAHALKKLEFAAAPPWGYAGYSQGATMGALMLIDHGDLFDRLILLEGGTEGWSRARAARYFEGGGRKILFGCGTPSCDRSARAAESAMRGAGLDVRVRSAEGAGHTYGGGVEDAITPELPWLF